MSKAKLVILDCWVSPFCMRVKIALNEKGLEYEAQAEDLFGGKSELLLSSNPIYKKVPVFLHDGKPLCESIIIVNYIDETWSSPPLLPPCSYGRAQARFWADFIDKKLEEALGDKDYFIGTTFGFIGGFTVEAECPKFSNWMKRCLQRESVAKVVPPPEKVYEFVLMFRKMQGID
ncbi:hypothetical protein CXB51_017350 [Gossypium anomalum]|uniref:Glutathione S-transferase n=1 Tax=Gossypium anomalum TaxID=47600 RepID=A0A8J6CYK1_9ROSI|nr:hypothetical protein CXB51_017350 [Gossypium anomalum]